MVKTKEILKNQGLTIYDIKKKTNQIEKDVLDIMHAQQKVFLQCKEIKDMVTRRQISSIGKIVTIVVDCGKLEEFVKERQYKTFLEEIVKTRIEYEARESCIRIKPFKIRYDALHKIATFVCDVISSEENDFSLLDAIEIVF